MSIQEQVAEFGGLQRMVTELTRWRAMFSSPEICSRELAALRAKAAELDHLVAELEERLVCAETEAQDCRWDALGEDL